MRQHARRTSNDTPSNVTFTRVPLSEQTPLLTGLKVGVSPSIAEGLYTTLTCSTPEKSCKMDVSSSFIEMEDRRVYGERENVSGHTIW